MIRWCVVLSFSIGVVLYSSYEATTQDINCNAPSSQVEYTACAHIAYEAADAELNAVYKRALATTRRMDAEFQAGAVPLADLLRDAQRAWIPFRDAACDVEAGLAQGGTAASQWYVECLEKMTRRRIADLTDVIGN